MTLSTALSSYPIFRLTIPLVTGIFLSDTLLRFYDLWVEHLIALAFLFLLLVIWIKEVLYAQRWIFGGLLYLFFLILGSFVVQLQWKEVAVDWGQVKSGYAGIIQEMPEEKGKTIRFRVRVNNKNVLLSLFKDSLSQSLGCGDEILFYTKIISPKNPGNPDEFDYASYLLRRQISGTAFVYSGFWHKTDRIHALTIKQQALKYRSRILDIYKEWGFTGQELAVLSALTVGYKEDLSDELRKSYSVAGISHVLALSGLHVGILWGLLAFLLNPLNRNGRLRILKWLIITALLWSYAFVTGLSASVIRAVIMCTLIELGQIKSSKGLSLNIMGIAAFLMLLYHPFYLFEVSFQLSFMAVLAILLFYQPIYHLCTIRYRIFKYFWGIIAVSVAAQLGTAPLVMYYFSSFSVYFLLANLMIAPLVFIIMYMALLAFFIFPFPFLHDYVLMALKNVICLLNGSAGWISNLPVASIQFVFGSEMEVALLYIIIGIGLGYWISKDRRTLIGFLTGILLFLFCLFFHRLPKATSPLMVFYNIPDYPVIHFIEADKSSYLFVNKWDSAFIRLQNVSRTYWEKEQLSTPRILTNGYESRKIWTHNGITRWHGINICVVSDNYWRNKTSGHLLDIDYMYLCKEYTGKIASLQKLFLIKKVVLDGSLSTYKSDAFKKECNDLGIDYIDISEQGSFHILL